MSTNNKTVLIWLAIILVILAWGGYKIYQQHQQDLYWQSLDTSTTYQGNGYKITFPCSDVKNTSLLNDADFNTSQDSCEYFGGDNHSNIDMYTVQASKYLSNKNNPYNDLNCSDYTDDTTGTQYHAIYHEKRTIDGVDVYICGWDSKIVNAKILNNNTVYTLNVTPTDTTTTYKKLNDFLATFQLQ